jgi:transcriptional regulator with XRE-family HTH domain
LKGHPKIKLGQNVCRLRQLLAMTQEVLAKKASIDRRYVQRIEAGTANPGVEVLDRLRRVFECSWDDLLGK